MTVAPYVSDDRLADDSPFFGRKSTANSDPSGAAGSSASHGLQFPACHSVDGVTVERHVDLIELAQRCCSGGQLNSGDPSLSFCCFHHTRRDPGSQ